MNIINKSSDSAHHRRELFPCDHNNYIDSDLDCVSIDCESDEQNNSKNDYDIISVLCNNKNSDNTTSNETPEHTRLITKVVPSQTFHKLGTPQEDILTITTMPRLTRKIPESTMTDLSNQMNKNSKVRTTLFPDIDAPLPTSAFYSNNQKTSTFTPSVIRIASKLKKQSTKNKRVMLSGSRKNRFGQINVSVRHGLKKPKKSPKISSDEALRKSLEIINNSPLNDFLNDFHKNAISSTQVLEPKCIEQLSREDEKTSSNPTPKVTIISNIILSPSNRDNTSHCNKKANLKRPLPTECSEMSKRLKLDQESSFDDNETDPLISTSQITNILDILEDKENQPTDVLMSPNTTQMCNMASGLAINSPKKNRNLTSILSDMNHTDDSAKKLFPIFYPQTSPAAKKINDISKNPSSKFKKTAPNQMQLDVGQKKFGSTQCHECHIVYDQGDPTDELMHENYHNSNFVFRFNGWKNERVCASFTLDTKIVQILPHDPKMWLKKAKDVLNIVDRDLGYYDMEDNDLSKAQIYFYIQHKKIVGVLVVEPATTAYKLLTSLIAEVDLCSEECYDVKCGVVRLWVSSTYRKQGIATSLMDTLKRNFMFGYSLTNSDIAFSSPTEIGKQFAQSYFKTPNFFVYFSQ